MRSISLTRRLGLLVVAAVTGAAAFVALASAEPNQPSAAQAKPSNTAAPTISDTTPESGQQLTAGPGTWTGDAPIVFTYQWLRCNLGGNNRVEIPSAGQQTYTAQSADVGNTLRVGVTAANVSGSDSATSDATSAVTRGAPPPAPARRSR